MLIVRLMLIVAAIAAPTFAAGIKGHAELAPTKGGNQVRLATKAQRENWIIQQQHQIEEQHRLERTEEQRSEQRSEPVHEAAPVKQLLEPLAKGAPLPKLATKFEEAPIEQQYVESREEAPAIVEAEPYSFSYETDSSARSESGDTRGVVRGSYRLTGGDGSSRQVDYVADHLGFRATVRTNEAGTDSRSPAHVAVHSSRPVEVVAAAPVVEPVVKPVEVVAAVPVQVPVQPVVVERARSLRPEQLPIKGVEEIKSVEQQQQLAPVPERDEQLNLDTAIKARPFESATAHRALAPIKAAALRTKSPRQQRPYQPIAHQHPSRPVEVRRYPAGPVNGVPFYHPPAALPTIVEDADHLGTAGFDHPALLEHA